MTPAQTPQPPHEPGSPRLVLWIGFSALLFLMVSIAILADQTLKQIQSGSAALRSELLLREGLLDRLRLGSIARASTSTIT